MGGGNKRKKKRKCYLPLWWIGTLQKKYRNKYKRNASSPIAKKRRKKSKSQDDVIVFEGELKDMRTLTANDEAFFLSTETVKHVIDIIRSRKTPTPETYKHWNEPVISFYLKMCTCFGVDYQHLEAATYEDDDDKEQETRIECAQPSTKEMPKSNEECSEQQTHIECDQPSTTEMSYEELLEQEENTPICSFGLCYLYGPFKFGSYSPETTPDRIPYHMYLLVKSS